MTPYQALVLKPWDSSCAEFAFECLGINYAQVCGLHERYRQSRERDCEQKRAIVNRNLAHLGHLLTNRLRSRVEPLEGLIEFRWRYFDAITKETRGVRTIQMAVNSEFCAHDRCSFDPVIYCSMCPVSLEYCKYSPSEGKHRQIPAKL
jgi:hypothetical protein